MQQHKHHIGDEVIERKLVKQSPTNALRRLSSVRSGSSLLRSSAASSVSSQRSSGHSHRSSSLSTGASISGSWISSTSSSSRRQSFRHESDTTPSGKLKRLFESYGADDKGYLSTHSFGILAKERLGEELTREELEDLSLLLRKNQKGSNVVKFDDIAALLTQGNVSDEKYRCVRCSSCGIVYNHDAPDRLHSHS